MEEHTIDATEKSLGRIASEAAMILRGKNSPDFTPNVLPKTRVHIINASKVNMTDKKLAETYAQYSGYPGGLKMVPRSKVLEKKGYAEIFKRTIQGMLPANKLRNEIMKHLTVSE